MFLLYYIADEDVMDNIEMQADDDEENVQMDMADVADDVEMASVGSVHEVVAATTTTTTITDQYFVKFTNPAGRNRCFANASLHLILSLPIQYWNEVSKSISFFYKQYYSKQIFYKLVKIAAIRQFIRICCTFQIRGYKKTGNRLTAKEKVVNLLIKLKASDTRGLSAGKSSVVDYTEVHRLCELVDEAKPLSDEKFNNYAQHDAQEYLQQLIECLPESCRNNWHSYWVGSLILPTFYL